MPKLSDYGTGMKSIVLNGLNQKRERLWLLRAQARNDALNLEHRLDYLRILIQKTKDPSYGYLMDQKVAAQLALWENKHG